MDRPTRKPMRRDAPPVDTLQVLRRLARYMTRWKGLFLAMLALMVLTLACELAIPLAVEASINAISFRRGLMVDVRALTFSLCVFLLLVVSNGVMDVLLGRVSAKISLNVTRCLRRDLFFSTMKQSVSSFDGMLRGDLMSRIMSDTELAAGAFCEAFRDLSCSILLVVGCGAIMLVKCPFLALVSMGTAALSVFVIGALSRLVFPVLLEQQSDLGTLNAHIEESLKGFRVCTSAGRMADNNRQMEQLSRKYYSSSIHAAFLEYLMGPVMLVLGNLNFLATVSFGARQIVSGAITVGAVQAFILYSRQFMEPLNSLGECFVRVQRALAGAERVFSVIDRRQEDAELKQAAALSAPAPQGEGYLTFHRVRFSYHQNLPVLRGIDLSLRKGEKLALVGKTGVGKTTLINLLLLFYSRFSGTISLDGTDIRCMDASQLRREISVVPQEPQIVDGSLLDNLTYGTPATDREEVVQVLKEMGLEDWFSRLPKGLDTQLRTTQTQLSQGQLQLICLIRAVLRRSSVLILDEATSSMDPDTEQMVQRGMQTAMAGRTCLMIAHRLSSVRDADHIAVLSDGVIAEYGTHESLMAHRGLYASLYNTQFSGKEI